MLSGSLDHEEVLDGQETDVDNIRSLDFAAEDMSSGSNEEVSQPIARSESLTGNCKNDWIIISLTMWSLQVQNAP